MNSPMYQAAAGRLTRLTLAGVLAALALSTFAADAPAPGSALTSQGLLSDLEAFIERRGGDVNQLVARSMVDLMVDWYRFDAKAASGKEDVLVFRTGGWSEGCATGFKLSVLRRVATGRVPDGDAARFAGITLMFEPSARSELAPYSTTSAEWQSMEGFVAAIEASPAFRGLDAAIPMGVMLESGGLR